jgi:hypothetical protein
LPAELKFQNTGALFLQIPRAISLQLWLRNSPKFPIVQMKALCTRNFGIISRQFVTSSLIRPWWNNPRGRTVWGVLLSPHGFLPSLCGIAPGWYPRVFRRVSKLKRRRFELVSASAFRNRTVVRIRCADIVAFSSDVLFRLLYQRFRFAFKEPHIWRNSRQNSILHDFVGSASKRFDRFIFRPICYHFGYRDTESAIVFFLEQTVNVLVQ